MLVSQIIFIILGMALLLGGAEWVVRGATSIALKYRVSGLVVGLTIVSFGTSLPELVVNLVASVDGAADIAIGNVVGSNISNIWLVLGVTGLIAPIAIRTSTVRREIPIAFIAGLLLLIFGNLTLGAGGPELSRAEGLLLIGCMGLFMWYVFRMVRRDRAEGLNGSSHKAEEPRYGVLASAGFIVAGIAGLIVGGNVLVDNAVAIAEQLGLSEALIGITIVGIGTSLPELATSAVAALRKQADLAVGNIVGSNIFNVFWIVA
jgi:cation:H+ antiporter